MYTAIRWAIAITLGILLVQGDWLPSTHSFDVTFRAAANRMAHDVEGVQHLLLDSTWTPSDDALINIALGVVHVLGFVALFLALLVILAVLVVLVIPLAIVLSIYDWLTAHSALFASNRHYLQMAAFSWVFYVLTRVIVPKDNRTSLDEGIKFAAKVCIVAALAALIANTLTNLGLWRTFIVSFLIGTPIGAIFGALRARERGVIGESVFLLGPPVVLIAEWYASGWIPK